MAVMQLGVINREARMRKALHHLDLSSQEPLRNDPGDDAVDRHGFTPQLSAVWSDVVDTLVDLWQRTAASGFDPSLATRNHEQRCHRGLQGLEYALAGNVSYESRIVVNGDDRGTWADLFASLTDLGTPAVHVTCHGDPHAGNVLVDAAAAGTSSTGNGPGSTTTGG
jgi:hypothetical protein